MFRLILGFTLGFLFVFYILLSLVCVFCAILICVWLRDSYLSLGVCCIVVKIGIRFVVWCLQYL